MSPENNTIANQEKFWELMGKSTREMFENVFGRDIAKEKMLKYAKYYIPTEEHDVLEKIALNQPVRFQNLLGKIFAEDPNMLSDFLETEKTLRAG